MARQPFTLMPGASLDGKPLKQASSHAEPDDECVWCNEQMNDDGCFNGKDICCSCCAGANGCCNDGTWYVNSPNVHEAVAEGRCGKAYWPGICMAFPDPEGNCPASEDHTG